MAWLDPNPDCQDSEQGWNFKRNASKYNAGFSTRSRRINKEAQLLLSLQNHIFQTQTTIVLNLVPWFPPANIWNLWQPRGLSYCTTLREMLRRNCRQQVIPTFFPLFLYHCHQCHHRWRCHDEDDLLQKLKWLRLMAAAEASSAELRREEERRRRPEVPFLNMVMTTKKILDFTTAFDKI